MILDASNKCDTAFETVKCYFEVAPEVRNYIKYVLVMLSIFFHIFLGCWVAIMRWDDNKSTEDIHTLITFSNTFFSYLF